MPEAENPRAVIGGNDAPDWAKLEAERLVKDYVGYDNTYADLVRQMAALPEKCPDDTTALKGGGIIKAARDLKARMEETRTVEGQPLRRRIEAINTHFGTRQDAIQPDDKRERLNRPGMIDRIQKWIDTWQDEKEARERARLAAEAKAREDAERLAREEADRKQRAADEAARVAREAEEATERTRTEATRLARAAEAEAAAKLAADTAAAAKAAEVKVETTAAANQDAYVASLAKPAAVVRVQGSTADGGGVTLTKNTEKFAFLTDRGELTNEAKLTLFEHFTDTEVDKAVRSFANSTRYLQQLPGCTIGTRKKGHTR